VRPVTAGPGWAVAVALAWCGGDAEAPGAWLGPVRLPAGRPAHPARAMARTIPGITKAAPDGTALAWPGLVRPGLLWPGLVWLGLVWLGLLWPGLVWLGLLWPGLLWPGLLWLARWRPTRRNVIAVRPY
jgi:hypothetical protein